MNCWARARWEGCCGCDIALWKWVLYLNCLARWGYGGWCTAR